MKATIEVFRDVHSDFDSPIFELGLVCIIGLDLLLLIVVMASRRNMLNMPSVYIGDTLNGIEELPEQFHFFDKNTL